MNSEPAIKVDGVSKTFKLPHEKHSSLKGVFLHGFRTKSYETQHALRPISFEVKKGEFFGIVGRNGSGKSTLLKLIAGIYTPDTGSIEISGILTPFIELGVGFNPELSGRDNVFLNGALFGKSRKDMEKLYDEIVEFAELGRFMDQKLKNYSSGMQVRLAFSIAIQIQSDILLLDEVLAVGDILFQQKCFNYFHQLKKDHKTVLFVSHDVGALRQYCTNGLLIEKGRLVTQGPIDTVLNSYIDIVSNKEEKYSITSSTSGQKHHGTGKVAIKSVTTRRQSGATGQLYSEDDKTIVVEARFKARQDVESPVYGITIRDEAGVKVFASNNMWLSQQSTDLRRRSEQVVVWTIPNIFSTGAYTISPAVADFSGRETYDLVDDIAGFKVRKKISTSAITNPAHTIELSDSPVK
jgi:ABC-2 type transport system ATP-binding protein